MIHLADIFSDGASDNVLYMGLLVLAVASLGVIVGTAMVTAIARVPPMACLILLWTVCDPK